MWDGIANPLALLPHTDSADPVSSGTLGADFEALMKSRMSTLKRKKLRNRQRVLAQYGDITFRRAATADEARAILQVFHAQKAERMVELGVSIAFAERGVAEFIEQAACSSAAIELYALYAGDRIAATCAGVTTRGRFSTMFNSITRDELANGSPGKILLLQLIESLCARGLTRFDLGIGEAQYKEIICDEVEPLFNNFLPLTTSGRMIAAAMQAAYVAKRTVKKTPALWSAVQTARRWRSRLSSAS
jgi:CelD/BcsL family acetyltransferase involved in cellulose biosynthesis